MVPVALTTLALVLPKVAKVEAETYLADEWDPEELPGERLDVGEVLHVLLLEQPEGYAVHFLDRV